MISRIEFRLRSIKRLFSRNRILVWLFGLPKSTTTDDRHGLIILQIDGLARGQLERALQLGSMPFLRNLLESENYKLHSVYSGVPSSTPASQGELLYGVPACVPAFMFKRPTDKKPIMMLDYGVAASIEKSLNQQCLNEHREPLLTGGSSFSNIFTGGASESSFCAASIGWSSIIPSSNFFKMVIFALLNIVSVFRFLALMVVELLLSVFDFFCGVFTGKNLLKELSFLPIRVLISVGLRELVAIGIRLDSARGLPIIHANFLGYDEQSHRRGPSSKFAHWSLKGIDKAIARIWHSAKQSEHRDYDVWIYSDHGQEETSSYPIVYSTSTQLAIESVLQDVLRESTYDTELTRTTPLAATNTQAIIDTSQLKRIDLFGNKWLSAWFAKRYMPVESKLELAEIAAMGPVGLIYLKKKISPEKLEKAAQQLVRHAHFPMALVSQDDEDVMRQVSVSRADGEFYLPQDKEHVFGRNHPFLDDVCSDVIALTKHPYAGDITILGWGNDIDTFSLRIENGAHGGAGANETHAFALLPADTKLPERNRPYLRFIDLFLAAKNELGQQVDDLYNKDYSISENTTPLTDKSEGCLRVLTYNVHSCIGMDGQMLPKRIARVIAMYDPDIIALQELVVGTTDLNQMDQATIISEQLNLGIHFHPIKEVEKGQFGNAVLSKYPMRLISARPLATKVNRYGKKFGMAPFYQERGALDVEMDINGNKVRLVTTHLGLTHEERKTQVEDLISKPPFSKKHTPAILCGDLNATPKQRTYKVLSGLMDDVQVKVGEKAAIKTFPSRYPSLRIDHMFVDNKIGVSRVTVPHNHLTKVASDHLPLVVDLDLSDFIVSS